jgi:hypothetical protein
MVPILHYDKEDSRATFGAEDGKRQGISNMSLIGTGKVPTGVRNWEPTPQSYVFTRVIYHRSMSRFSGSLDFWLSFGSFVRPKEPSAITNVEYQQLGTYLPSILTKPHAAPHSRRGVRASGLLLTPIP